jgi:hypothetical protein
VRSSWLTVEMNSFLIRFALATTFCSERITSL